MQDLICLENLRSVQNIMHGITLANQTIEKY